MNDQLLKAYVYTEVSIGNALRRANEEDGVETLEWLGMMALVLAFLGAISKLWGDGRAAQVVTTAFENTLANWITNMQVGN